VKDAAADLRTDVTSGTAQRRTGAANVPLEDIRAVDPDSPPVIRTPPRP